MNRFCIGLLVVGTMFVILSGCAISRSGPHNGCAYFQHTRGNEAHIMRDRIYNPNYYRHQHDDHILKGTEDGYH